MHAVSKACSVPAFKYNSFLTQTFPLCNGRTSVLKKAKFTITVLGTYSKQ